MQWELFVYFIEVTATHARFARFSYWADILISHRKSINPGRSQSPLVFNSCSYTIASSSACVANTVMITLALVGQTEIINNEIQPGRKEITDLNLFCLFVQMEGLVKLSRDDVERERSSIKRSFNRGSFASIFHMDIKIMFFNDRIH